jgi:hypothetical protein
LTVSLVPPTFADLVKPTTWVFGVVVEEIASATTVGLKRVNTGR